jgi:hypothetical protein
VDCQVLSFLEDMRKYCKIKEGNSTKFNLPTKGGIFVYLAEIRGKIPGKLEFSEDLLTSNVFSFFKYSNRSAYLAELFERLEIPFEHIDLEQAEFLFWPVYQDGTEPDLVLVTPNLYILVEAKYGAGFGNETFDREAQLEREYEMGMEEAANLDKQFFLVTITADYNFPMKKFNDVPDIANSPAFRWVNWQSISAILMLKLVQYPDSLPDRMFAQDLLDLLDKKNLRSFISYEYLSLGNDKTPENLFFSYDTANYRNAFIGFSKSLALIPKIQTANRLFYSKRFFANLSSKNILDSKKNLFFRRN